MAAPLSCFAILSTNARHFFRGFTQAHLLNWQEFTSRLRQNFIPRNRQDILRNKLETLKQKNQVEDYIKDFDELMSQIKFMSDYDVVRSFIKGLEPRTRDLVQASDPQSIYEAKEKALSVVTFNQFSHPQNFYNEIENNNNNKISNYRAKNNFQSKQEQPYHRYFQNNYDNTNYKTQYSYQPKQEQQYHSNVKNNHNHPGAQTNNT